MGSPPPLHVLALDLLLSAAGGGRSGFHLVQLHQVHPGTDYTGKKLLRPLGQSGERNKRIFFRHYVSTAWPYSCAVRFAVSPSCKRPRYVLPLPGSALMPCGAPALPADLWRWQR